MGCEFLCLAGSGVMNLGIDNGNPRYQEIIRVDNIFPVIADEPGVENIYLRYCAFNIVICVYYPDIVTPLE
jgi:hypothetical protein